MSLYPPPKDIITEVWTEIPNKFHKKNVQTPWVAANKFGMDPHSFLEGPSFDRNGNLYVVDIPFGRIFRISPDKEWTLVTEYDGEPNGLKMKMAHGGIDKKATVNGANGRINPPYL